MYMAVGICLQLISYSYCFFGNIIKIYLGNNHSVILHRVFANDRTVNSNKISSTHFEKEIEKEYLSIS